MKDNIASRIEALQRKEEQHKQKLAELAGRKGQLMEQLKSQFGIETLEDAKTKLESLRKSVEKRESRIEKQLSGLEVMVNGQAN